MKKLPIIIMLSAASITGVAMAAGTSTGGAYTGNGASTEVGRDMGSYGKTSGATGSRVSGTNGAAGTTYGTNGAAGTTTRGTSGMNGASEPMRGPTSTSSGALKTPNTSGTEIGRDYGGYGKAAGAEGSQVSPGYGSARGTTGAPVRTNGAAGMTNGAAGGTMQRGPGMTGTTGTSGVTWSCPSGYTLSTATRDGTPLCYPNTGPMPGR